jgi:protein arginine N-methyltransferase 1
MTMEYYRGMLTQRTRVEAFRRALAAAVRPGDRVLEIGTGLGTYAFFAADAGAAKVWAVEGAAVAAVARAIARRNGYEDRVEVIRGWFPGVTLPERVDVLIYEEYPSRLLDDRTYAVLGRLHRDVLAPGARVVPHRARIRLAPMYSERVWGLVGPLAPDGDTAYDIDWSPSREYVVNAPLHAPLRHEDLRHEPQVIADVTLYPLPPAAALAGEASWTFERETVIHGLGCWFDLEVGRDVWLSNAPGDDPGSWGYLYLPIPEALTVSRGETLVGRVAPEVTSEGAPSWLTWEVRCGGKRYRGHEFKSFPASLADVLPRSPSWVPQLTDSAQLELQILRLADGTRSVEEIARVLRAGDGAVNLREARNLVAGTLARRTKSPAAWGS